MIVQYTINPSRDISVKNLLLRRLEETIIDRGIVFVPLEPSIPYDRSFCIVKIDTDIEPNILGLVLRIVTSTPWFGMKVLGGGGVEVLRYTLGSEKGSSYLIGRSFYVDCKELPLDQHIETLYPLGEARAFNSVCEIDGRIEKTSTQVGKLYSEFLFLKRMNQEQASIYPKVYDFNKFDLNQGAKYSMERVYGSTFSALLKSDELEVGWLLEFLDTYYELISTKNIESVQQNRLTHTARLRERHESRTKSLLGDVIPRGNRDNFFYLSEHEVVSLNTALLLMLERICIEPSSGTHESEFLHGDLVFSNIIRDVEGSYKCVDPNGTFLIGPPFGIYYDLAKILQCLSTNYDSWLQGEYSWQTIGGELFPVGIKTSQRELLRHFQLWLKKKKFSYDAVKKLCILHLYAMMPLHQDNPMRIFATARTIRLLYLEVNVCD